MTCDHNKTDTGRTGTKASPAHARFLRIGVWRGDFNFFIIWLVFRGMHVKGAGSHVCLSKNQSGDSSSNDSLTSKRSGKPTVYISEKMLEGAG